MMDVRFPDCSKHGQGAFLVNYATARRNRDMARRALARKRAFAEADAVFKLAEDTKVREASRPKLLMGGGGSGGAEVVDVADVDDLTVDPGLGDDDDDDDGGGGGLSKGIEVVEEEEAVDEQKEGEDLSPCGAVYQRLMLWHVIAAADVKHKAVPMAKTHDVSRDSADAGRKEYVESYLIRRGNPDTESPVESIARHVLLRMGSWCYGGKCTLRNVIRLEDVPAMVQSLRGQQSKLAFAGATDKFPVTSPFGLAMAWLHTRLPLAQDLVAGSVELLEDLLGRLRRTGLSEGVEDWLGGEVEGSFFQCQFAAENGTSADCKEFDAAFKDVDVAVTKVYDDSGVMTVGIVFERSLYICIRELPSGTHTHTHTHAHAHAHAHAHTHAYY